MSDYPEIHVSPACPRCGTPRATRVKRQGILQRLILHRFGMFPWECTGCRCVFMFKDRGKIKRRRRSSGEVHLPPVA